MSKVEFNSFLKSFILFFITSISITTFSFYLDYQNKINLFNNQILLEMRTCFISNKYCRNFIVKDVKKDKQKLFELYIFKDKLISFYPNNDTSYKLIETKEKLYKKYIKNIYYSYISNFILIIIGIIFISISFSLYSLKPLKESLELTNEFIKDFLHDINTPLSSIILNLSLLKRKFKDKEINRIELSINNIMYLQMNLKSYIEDIKLEKTTFDLNEMLIEEISIVSKLYSNRKIINNIYGEIIVNTSKDMLFRIFLNIITNAFKYNVKNGIVKFEFNDGKIKISNQGKLIKNTNRIFERFYKENERGIGIGLHIVSKLAKQTNVNIKVVVENEYNVFYIDITNILLK